MNFASTSTKVGLTSIACLSLIGVLLMPPNAKAQDNPLASPSDPAMVQKIPISRTYNLSSCFNIADQNNKDIAVAKHNLEISRAGIRIAGAIPNPQLQVQTGFGDSFLYLFTGQTQQAFLTEQLQTAGKRSKKIAVARQTYKISDTQLSALRFDVHNRVRRAYCELAAAEAYDLLIQRQRKVASDLLEIAKSRAIVSKDDSDVVQATLNVDQFDPLLNQVEGRLQQASTSLSLLLGTKPERVEIFDVDDTGLFEASATATKNVPSPEQVLPQIEDLIHTSMTAKPELKMAQDRVVLSRKSLALTRAEKVPDVFIGSGFTFASFAKNQPVGLANASNYFGEGAFFTMSTEAPVFYQHQGEIQTAVGTARQAELQVDLLKSQTAASIVSDYNSVKTSRENLLLIKGRLLPTAAALAQSALDSYEKGSVDLATVLVAQQQLQQSLSSFFDTVVLYQNSWADLERDVGVPLQN